MEAVDLEVVEELTCSLLVDGSIVNLPPPDLGVRILEPIPAVSQRHTSACGLHLMALSRCNVGEDDGKGIHVSDFASLACTQRLP